MRHCVGLQEIYEEMMGLISVGLPIVPEAEPAVQ